MSQVLHWFVLFRASPIGSVIFGLVVVYLMGEATRLSLNYIERKTGPPVTWSQYWSAYTGGVIDDLWWFLRQGLKEAFIEDTQWVPFKWWPRPRSVRTNAKVVAS